MTEFAERYKSLSNFELLEIIAESIKYQPIAVESAKKEIECRQLSEEELKQIEDEIKFQQLKKQKEIEKRKRQEDKIKTTIIEFLDTINPIQNGIQPPEKMIRLITIVFTGLSIYRIYEEFGLLMFMFSDLGEWDLSMIVYFSPLILLPLTIFLFWKREKVGWIFLSIFLTYSSITPIALFFMNFDRQPLGIVSLESIFLPILPITYIMTLLFFGGILWVISKRSIKDIYKVTNKAMYTTIGLTIVITVVSIISLSLKI